MTITAVFPCWERGIEAWDGEEEGRQGKVKGQRKRGGTFLEEGNWGKERTITKLYLTGLKGLVFSVCSVQV